MTEPEETCPKCAAILTDDDIDELQCGSCGADLTDYYEEE